jgi:hypothetical protein
MGQAGVHTPPVKLLKDKWNHFIDMYGPDVKILVVCHSGGAIHVKNALATSHPDVRQKIIVVAIAPAVIVPDELCYSSDNYVSKRDFVTHLDVVGKVKYGDQLTILEPHSDAKLWDHDFASPTFTGKLQEHIDGYIENYGGMP